MSRFLFILSIGFIIGPASVFSSGEDRTAQKDVPYFTEEDLERYKESSGDNPQTERLDRKAEGKEKTGKAKKEENREYWCKTANTYRNKIDKARDEIAEIEKELRGEGGTPLGPRKRRTLENELRRAQKQRRNAERDLSELEEEAHRKGIPPGWLRCQFE
ncbi:MAG: OmpH family outer membrane protein [Nitrospirae bacterium]|nr:OmpH family outer membrane protein [Nitrospirota bacterium]